MFRVRVAALAGVPGHSRGRAEREFVAESLSECLVRALAMSDVVASEAISQGPLLIEHVVLQLVIAPSVQRTLLIDSWLRAVAEVNGIVDIVPDEPGQASQGHQSRPDSYEDGVAALEGTAAQDPAPEPRKKGGRHVRKA